MQEAEDPSCLWENGAVKIYNFKQLQAIGTGQNVRYADMDEQCFGTGEPLQVNGEDILYSSDSHYILMNDIPLPKGQIWTLPDNFAGTFSYVPSIDDLLYESASDTIFIYNIYQLNLVNSDNSANEPLLSQDMMPASVGVGKLVYPEGESSNYLTYSKDHNYVISKKFTAQMPALLAEQYTKALPGDEQLGGREYLGQQYVTIGNEKYILIGNEQQLRAVGSNKSVTPMLFLKTEAKLLLVPLGNKIVPFYPGDADLNVASIKDTGITYKDIKVGTEDFQYKRQADANKANSLMNIEWGSNTLLGDVVGLVGGLVGDLLGELLGSQELVGLKLEAGKQPSIGADGSVFTKYEYTSFQDLRREYEDLKYATDANYIIFRDIDLAAGPYSNGADDAWKPLHFSGHMEGRLHMQTSSVPSVSHVHVEQTGKLNMQDTYGIGFFGTISNVYDESTFTIKKDTTIKNIHLNQVTIENRSTQVEQNVNSLLEGVLGLVGGLLGGLLNGLDTLLPGVNLKLGDVIRDLLTLKMASPDIFATGSFAGRIVGKVKIENCHVTQASVASVKGYSGGFVGYTEGVEEYDGLSDVLGITTKVLAAVLNIVPGVGLGDLITILLRNDIPLGKLMPTKYHKVQLLHCDVGLRNGTIGVADQSYNGGFVGLQIGTDIRQAIVTGLTRVQADNFAGGFAGMERDGMIKGLLNDVGLVLYTLDAKSWQEQCRVEGQGLMIQAAKAYAGGANGAMTNSIAKDCAVIGLQNVSAGTYAGGFSGRATIGYGTTIAGDDEKKATLLDSVSRLLGNVLQSNDHDLKVKLLTLAGVLPSEIHGCLVQGEHLHVFSTQAYAGGLLGQGDGVIVNPSGQTYGAEISGIENVTATRYAGGIAGCVLSADIIGVLNSTLGVGEFVPFTLSNIHLSGANLSVAANEKYAAGGCGLMLGGNAESIVIDGLASVESGNYAGGFAGRTGASSLAETAGLNILGLIKIDHVLSFANGMQVKITNSHVTGTNAGLAINAAGTAVLTDAEDFTAGGFIGEAAASVISDSSVRNLRMVYAAHSGKKKSYAGGFIGRSFTGGLAGLAEEQADGSLKLPGLLEVKSLLDLVPYLLPKYINTNVSFIANGSDPQVTGTFAGGYVGSLQSGKVDNSQAAQGPYVVEGLTKVQGESHAGGFAGKVDAGAAASSNGLGLLAGILQINISQLIQVLEVYVPIVTSAGVKSQADGFVVEASDPDSYAGGYIGYGGGVQIKNSNVTSLKHTHVVPPVDGLESDNGDSYFGQSSHYAVKAGKYAGGYAGCVDIDSAASVGAGLNLLGGAIQLTNLLDALHVVVSTITNSHVTGCTGGYSVLADGLDHTGSVIGHAGGYIGKMSGTIVKNSNAGDFAYIIGHQSAGGYAGTIEPGNVAEVIDQTSILNGLLVIEEGLADLVQAFIPVIEDCQTSSVPCGGAIRADGYTDDKYVRGLAGGYVGHNYGGRILGNTTECAAIRIRSIYGGEYAGGFTGLMETANLASTGNLQILFGLVKASNVLRLLGAVYPTETHTAVYGPLRKIDLDTWNKWITVVGANGVYGSVLPQQTATTEAELQQFIRKYAYGYHVKAARSSVGRLEKQAGDAGGYVGCMKAGVITDAHAWDAKYVQAYKSAGGFAGEMITGGVTEIGGLSLLGIPITGTISAVQTFVPVIRNSDSTGFQSGLHVKALGIPRSNTGKVEKIGYAGGYVGNMCGGQVWGKWNAQQVFGAVDAVPDPHNQRCFIANLRKVEGTNAIGGFAGQVMSGSAAVLDTASSQGLLGGLLQKLLNTPQDLLSVLNATIAVIRYADVDAWDPWGIVINGAYADGSKHTAYATSAGGFVGQSQGAVIGVQKQADSGANVHHLRSVTGGEYAGGFFGLADVTAAAQVGAAGETTLLQSLLSLGKVSVLDAFRTFIYHSHVSGAQNSGLEVLAKVSRKTGFVNDPVYQGTAGGFGGALLDGSVKDSYVTGLRLVSGMNYTGGFIGHLGKSGAIDLDKLGLLGKFISAGAGVMDIFGSHVDNCKVTGIGKGYTVHSHNTMDHHDHEEIAGGFTGYADLGRLHNDHVENLKQVTSTQIAGGFAGKTSFAYLADIKVDSPFVNALVKVVNEILKALQLGNLQNGQIIHVNLGVIQIDALYDGNLVALNLFGMKVTIGLVKETGLAVITIGDSKIEINCSQGGTIDEQHLKNEINIALIKANRTKIDGCSTSGIRIGYDVYGGNAENLKNGSGPYGIAGGFTGWNNEGLLQHNEMYFADVIAGTKGLVGPFTGKASLNSNWDFNELKDIEGLDNYYRIYRNTQDIYENLCSKFGNILHDLHETTPEWKNVYTIRHLTQGKVVSFSDLKDAILKGTTNAVPADVYRDEGARAVLMDGVSTSPTKPLDVVPSPDVQDPCKDTIALRIQKKWQGDHPKNRPLEVSFHITRSYVVNGTEIQDERFAQDITLTQSDAVTSDIGERILSGKEYPAYRLGSDGKKYMYHYHISETKADGYTTTVIYHKDDPYTLTVVNKRKFFDLNVPETGGEGTSWIYMIGILLLCLAAMPAIKQGKRKQNDYK